MRDDLVDLVQDAAAEPLQMPDFDAMAARGRRQRRMTQVIGGAASALVLLVAGVVLWPSPPPGMPVVGDTPTAAPTPSSTMPGEGGTPFEPDAQMRPDLMMATPNPAAPGETVELTYPEGTRRGVAFVLERQLPDGSWDHVYFLIASPADRPDNRPEWFTPEEDPTWPAVGVGGQGPDPVIVPETAEPGEYRICTAGAGNEFCTPLRIEGEIDVPPVPTPADLQEPYEPLFAGLPAPQGDGVLVATDSRIDGLGAFIAPSQPLPLDQTTSWTDAAVVTDPAVNVDLARTGVARPGGAVEFVLVNRGTAGVVHGVGYQLDQLVDGTWSQIEDPGVKGHRPGPRAGVAVRAADHGTSARARALPAHHRGVLRPGRARRAARLPDGLTRAFQQSHP